jgi:predicted Zn-dependent peptidase
MIYAPVLHTLENGVRVVVDVVPTVASAAVGIWIEAGTRDEPRGQAGMAHFVEHIAFRRTTTRTANKIAQSFEDAGAYANAFTTKEETVYTARTLVTTLPNVFATLADVVLNPAFTQSDLEKEQRIIIEEIRSYEDEPEEHIFDLGEQLLFGTHPLASPIVGSVESVQRISRDAAMTFHAERYTADRIVIAVSGNVDVASVLKLAQQHFSSVPRAPRKRRRTAPKPLDMFDREIMRPVQQAHTLWQLRTPGSLAPERWALLLMNVILGDGMSSRLNVRLRESKGLAYSVYSQIQLFVDVGVWALYAGVEPKRRAAAAEMIAQELQKLRRGGISLRELQRAKEQLRASKLMSLESLSSRMSMAAKGVLDEHTPEDPTLVIKAIEGVNRSTINDLLATMCDPDLWSRCTLLPEHDRA